MSLCLEPVSVLDKLRVVKEKTRTGRVDRVTDAKNVIVRDLFAKETS